MTYLFRLFLLAGFLLTGVARSSLAENPRTYPLSDTPVLAFTDPDLPQPKTVRQLLPGMSDLWVAALHGSELDLRYQAAVAIARAHDDGYRDMSDAVEPLMQALQVENQAADVKVQIARALVLLEARQTGDVLEKYLGEQRHFDTIVEPALARWKTATMQPVWRDRLLNAEAPLYQRRLAVECVRLCGDTEATADLLTIAAQSSNHPLRLAAAESAAGLATSGLEEVASRLISRADGRADAIASADRIVAVRLLAGSTKGEQSELLPLADGLDNTAAALAWRRLFETSPALLESRIESGLKHPDARVREVAIGTALMFADADRVRLLGLALDDFHPPVRLAARKALEAAVVQQQFKVVADETVLAMLKSSSWRGFEQASFYAGAVAYQPAAERLLELIRHPRPEVAVAAAYALRQLAVLETLPAMLAYASEISPKIKTGVTPRHFEGVLTYLFESFGTMQYRPADKLLKSWLPRTAEHVAITFPRAAAIDALGRLYADSGDEVLARLLLDRVTDPGTIPPESETAKYAAAIAIRRVNCAALIPDLRSLPDGSQELNQAVNWTLHHLAGDALTSPPPVAVSGTGWFLIPLN